MSTWKLEKLCYYSQAWQLAWTEKPLFEEEFEAWANGPVCPELFNAHRGRFWIDATMLTKGDPSNLTADEQETIDIVLQGYGDREAYDLREQTHSEPPWKDARAGCVESEPSKNIITKPVWVVITVVCNMAKNKRLTEQRNINKKTINEVHNSTDTSLIVWSFDQIDREGRFAFDVKRGDFQPKLILSNMYDEKQLKLSPQKLRLHCGSLFLRLIMLRVLPD